MASFSPGTGRRTGVPAGPSSVPAPSPGTLLFARYRLEAYLGSTAAAEVWRADDERLDRVVALRLIHRHLLPDERSRERFAAEARAVAGLAHPGVVTVLDVVVDDQQAAIVLEPVDGEPLSDVIARTGRLTEVAAASITIQVALALQAAHDRGLVHRDVKPANVVLSVDGHARLVDFGIARALDDGDASSTVPGNIMARLRYLAPEQLADGGADRATDVFGLGSLLYEMLVSRPPFPAATPAALMAQQRQGAPHIHGVSPELAGLARSALQVDPERRPRSAGRTAAMLARWLDNRGIAAADLPAVAAAALAGAPIPRVTPGVEPRSPGDTPTRPPMPPESRGLPAGIDLEGVGAGAASMSSSASARTAADVNADAVMAVPPAGRPVPIALAWRRVPLVAALDLAGVLLAGLLVAGSLAGLQAGASRSGPGASLLPARGTATPPPSPTPGAAVPARTVAPVRITTLGPRPARVDRAPRASPPRDHQQREKE